MDRGAWSAIYSCMRAQESDRTWPTYSNSETRSLLKTKKKKKKKNTSLFLFVMSVSFKETKGLKLPIYTDESLLP